ncbi:hypothetical protein LAUMK4_03461 [Mycobacterium persicum]|uniref:Uncharacterized protein n=2 Tax=Mycobacterium TaxID=1763 RepID=A0A7G1IC63_MYCKA|nr:hypothetical protein NIIDMKKI_23450 [Mycobacterium kansasii]VAZ77318.1 hypothetical protein LAUMK15_03775 [Mycobacterium persicum]VAZ84686.1 hypothetical protein LAUMK42_03510 [Mycobacterium persicum]VAZ96290.1 hypothetical protein LAUMK4_03461 [Mycobacterium persicum]
MTARIVIPRMGKGLFADEGLEPHSRFPAVQHFPAPPLLLAHMGGAELTTLHEMGH